MKSFISFPSSYRQGKNPSISLHDEASADEIDESHNSSTDKDIPVTVLPSALPHNTPQNRRNIETM
jgi:hypothetical protein